MQKIIQNGLVAVFILVSFSYSVFTGVRILAFSQLQDFRLYYLGAQSILLGKNPYTEVQGVIYPPISLAILTPFATLPVELAEDIWTICSLSALLVSILLLLQVAKNFSIPNFLVVFGLAMLSFPVKFNLGMGQINLFLLLLACLAFYWYRKRQLMLAGGVLALAAALKLTPLILLVFFLKKKQWRVVISCLVGFGLLNGLGVLLLGTAVTTDYWQKIFPAIPTVGNAVYYNQALTGWLARIEVPNQTASVINGLFLIGMLTASWLIIKRSNQKAMVELSEFSLLFMVTLIGGGLAWQHHFVSLLIPFVALTQTGFNLKIKRHWLFATLIFSYLLVSFNLKQPNLVGGFWRLIGLSHVLIGTVMLYCLTLIKLKTVFEPSKPK